MIEELNVSRETSQRLEVFENLIGKWNQRINLVSRGSLADLRHRHIADSIQVFRIAPAGKRWLDLGSGGGFPGLIAAILAIEERPDLKVTLIESDQRKAAFLRTAAREVGVTCTILPKRIEHVDPVGANILTARALAPLSGLLGFADQHLDPAGTALFSKGVSWKEELETARQQWHFDVDVIESQTMPGAAILRIEGVTRA
ncbi:MAG: 16S rRNA (guanine(527)-N(7))-methyltransferase RsmG [Rhodobacteraceae bacterium]|nr:16S rRNA (guanine(527)-N(7))-methyltransferase RsmG [Paracoccaceae bacterium]